MIFEPGFHRMAMRILVNAPDTPINGIDSLMDMDTYDGINGWKDLGSTKTGANIGPKCDQFAVSIAEVSPPKVGEQIGGWGNSRSYALVAMDREQEALIGFYVMAGVMEKVTDPREGRGARGNYWQENWSFVANIWVPGSLIYSFHPEPYGDRRISPHPTRYN